MNGGQGAWRKKVDSFKLENLTTAKINVWKKRYVEKAGYFMALIKRAETGDLHLHRSIFGILQRESGL